MASLKGKVIAITGAASGIARAIAHVLYSRGASLALADFNAEGLQETASQLSGGESDQKITTTTVDVRNSDQVDQWIQQTVKELGRLDCAANMAGVLKHTGTIADTSKEDFEYVMSINCTGVFNCLRAELKHVSSGGSIVSAASIAGLSGSPGLAAYVASKHAVIGLTRTAAKEVGPKGIRVNCVAPGLIQTPMLQTLENAWGPEVSLQAADRIPLQRQAEPEEVAKVIAFLLSDDASYVSGSVYQIDAGLLC